ncbi:DUF4435 domain-containing protein [Chryseobacterium sp. CFS15]|uniref:DUF4435 domain-containing protein n=1 Tax=Chryseobacterium sp. CFS15 TaxID=2986946 RepID=UPI002806603D|nr:DUF4435 domain-containing protein [Chryseobacterium sp. CFS15]MDQ8141112.1 DUF4435 domain-containing protein [Chryseobacterium sp. CFS15]
MSIREDIDGNFLANSIMMDSFFGYHILVEGQTDELFYSKFLSSEYTNIMICHGKEKVIEAVQILDRMKTSARYIAIIDKDYDFLDSNIIISNNLLRTDVHDVETMCIQSLCFDDFSREYIQKTKVNKIEDLKTRTLREHIFEIAIPIAKARILSLKNSYSLKFKPVGKEIKELDYTKFVCKNSFSFLGNVEMLNTLKLYFNQGLPKTIEDMEKEIESLNLENFNIHDVVHGHDLTNILVIGIKKSIGRSSFSNIKREDVERALRLAYSKEEFTKTQIYNHLLKLSPEILNC